MKPQSENYEDVTFGKEKEQEEKLRQRKTKRRKTGKADINSSMIYPRLGFKMKYFPFQSPPRGW